MLLRVQMNAKQMIWIVSIVVVIVSIIGIYRGVQDRQQEDPSFFLKNPSVELTKICVSTCISLRNQSVNLSSGPCLLDPMPTNTDWVCDVAHTPRTLADNDPEHQCAAYRNGSATHYIEVTPSCSVIITS
ncbi:MAG: hypothetical protein H6502_04875 [Candidatus Woesearchaeota archaeon]|nr:MAG: hypothetical protein H6502_04875 [Candidatus Woesearchaeota archaeon]